MRICICMKLKDKDEIVYMMRMQGAELSQHGIWNLDGMHLEDAWLDDVCGTQYRKDVEHPDNVAFLPIMFFNFVTEMEES